MVGRAVLRPMAELTLQLMAREIARIPITKVTTTIGRDPDSDVLIDNVGVSRIHATIQIQNGHCVLVDNGSENGTFVNGRRVSTHMLADGAEIQIGKHIVRLHLSSGPALPGSQVPPSSRRPVKTLWGLGDSPQQAEPAKQQPRSVVRTMHMSEDQVARAIASGQLNPAARRPPPAAPVPEKKSSFGLILVGVILLFGFLGVAAGLTFLILTGRIP